MNISNLIQMIPACHKNTVKLFFDACFSVCKDRKDTSTYTTHILNIRYKQEDMINITEVLHNKKRG
jgi:hypothetical protein